MAVPKRKTSPSRRNMRHSQNSKYSLVQIAIDKTTGEAKLAHHVSPSGYYNGKLVVNEAKSE